MNSQSLNDASKNSNYFKDVFMSFLKIEIFLKQLMLAICHPSLFQWIENSSNSNDVFVNHAFGNGNPKY